MPTHPIEIRCGKKLHGIIRDGVLEVQCRSRFCKPRPDAVVMHRWDITTGEQLPDELFRDPFPAEPTRKE